MKARIKATGTGETYEIVNVSGSDVLLSDGNMYDYSKLEYIDEPDRRQVRIQFVGQIASAIMSNYEFYAQAIGEECIKSGKSRPEMVAQMSLEITDALIEGLEKGGEE